MAASKSWDIFHLDLETAFLQGQSLDVNRDVVRQLPPEAGHPPYIAARLQKPAYGMNDASRRWWNTLDKALCSYGMVPTRADRLCYVLYSTQSRERAWEPWRQKAIAQSHGTGNVLTESRERSKNGCFEKMLDPIAGSPATGKSVAGIINLFVDDLFGTGGQDMEQRVLARLRKDFHVGSEDWNDETFTGQRFRCTKDPQTGSHIEVSQEKAVEELEERRRSQWNATRKILPLYPCNAYRIHKLSGTNTLATEKDTVSVVLQVFQMCLNDSLSNNWRCEGSQQAGEAAQVTASETSVLALQDH